MKIIFVKIVAWVLGGLCALLAAAGCSAAGATPGSPAAQPRIVTAFYPFQFIAQRVAGDHAVVSSLTAPGAEPHDLELTPRQVGSISAATLVVYERTFQPAVDEAVAQSGNRAVLDTATVVPLENHGSVGAGTPEGGGLDPHVWLDPAHVATITDAVAMRLAAIDPSHAPDYSANASTLDKQLSQLDSEFRTGLSACRIRDFITTHAAFGYLAERYHLNQIGISGLNPDTEPSPARIAAVQREATERGVTTIFFETLSSPAVATAIAGDLGLRTDVLDPLEGVTARSRGTDYLSIMAANLAALRKAGDCR